MLIHFGIIPVLIEQQGINIWAMSYLGIVLMQPRGMWVAHEFHAIFFKWKRWKYCINLTKIKGHPKRGCNAYQSDDSLQNPFQMWLVTSDDVNIQSPLLPFHIYFCHPIYYLLFFLFFLFLFICGTHSSQFINFSYKMCLSKSLGHSREPYGHPNCFPLFSLKTTYNLKDVFWDTHVFPLSTWVTPQCIQHTSGTLSFVLWVILTLTFDLEIMTFTLTILSGIV